MASYTNEELSKFKKDTLYAIIDNYCEQKNGRFTNLRKATKPKLIDLIKKYDMPKIEVEEEPKNQYTNPFKVGTYIYNETTDCDGDKIHSCYDINIYRTTKYTISYTLTAYGKTTDYKQRKVMYLGSTGLPYVNREQYSQSLYYDKFK